MHRRRNARNVNPHHHKIKWQTIFSSFSEFINLMLLLVVDRSSCILHGNIYCWCIHFMSVCQLKINTTSSKACFQWKFNSIEIEMKLLKKHNVKLASFDMFANCNSTVHSFQFNSFQFILHECAIFCFCWIFQYKCKYIKIYLIMHICVTGFKITIAQQRELINICMKFSL